jgi:hypothetical protein
MALPISTWALIAGLLAGVVVILWPRTSGEMPAAVVWLAAWAVLFVTQAVAWWALKRRRSA